jgi:TRAP-type C4-dicarboxylate transport system permease small subunit
MLPAAVPLAFIMYVAVSKKTGPRTRIAALIALAVMILTVIACLFIIFGGAALVKGDAIRPLDIPAENTSAPGSDLWVLLAFIIFLSVLFVVVAVLSFRERRRLQRGKKNSGPRAA